MKDIRNTSNYKIETMLNSDKNQQQLQLQTGFSYSKQPIYSKQPSTLPKHLICNMIIIALYCI